MNPITAVTIGGVRFGEGSLGWILGPCSLENERVSLTVAETLLRLKERYSLALVFKGSFDKANRLRGDAPRGPGLEEGLRILEKVKRCGLPVLTDIHEAQQAEAVAAVVDALQIPAFLVRQTDIVVSAARTGKPLLLKKGQFIAPEDMKYAVLKATHCGNSQVLIAERGTCFGYRDLVVDFRGVVQMSSFAPVIFDATHAVQTPGGGGGESSGQREFVVPLSRAALAVGVAGLFMETHPDPEQALSDRHTQIPLKELPRVLEALLPFLSLYESRA